MVKQFFVFFFLFIIIIGTGLYFYLSKTYPDTKPLLSAQYFIEHLMKPHAKLSKHIMGFLPYWQIDNIQYLKPEELSDINYFSLDVGSDGHILTTTNGQSDPGWREWQGDSIKNLITKAHIDGTDVSITVAALDNTLITTILDSDTNQQNLINDIVKAVQSRNLDAVNIVFEYTGTPDAGYDTKFTNFSSNLKNALNKQRTGTKLSLSIMPLSARETGLFDFAKLSSVYDRFIGMSYDYYGQSSDIAGPIAPMNGFKENKYFFDVTTTYADYLKVIPKEKIIMGIPYYGWDWAVVDGKMINSRTFPATSADNYAAVNSYALTKTSSTIKKNQCSWDTISEETWCWYTDTKTGIDHQVWIADDRSVQTRFDFANNQDFDGIAIWTLGSDKQYPDLWNMLHNTFSTQ